MKLPYTDLTYSYFFPLISRYLFRSGNIETNGDRFYNTTVEVLPANVSVMPTPFLSSYQSNTQKWQICFQQIVSNSWVLEEKQI